ncbi:MAG: ABC transporter permease [Actinomycetota bacterium]
MSATTGVPALREIRGPSAFGGGAKRFFDLTWLMSVTDFKMSYFGTVFGYLWSLVRPLMLFAVLYTVFTRILRFDAPNYAQMLLLSLTLYGLFSEATTRAVRSVVTSERIVRKMQFPRLVIPLSVVLTSLFNLCLSLIAVLVFIAASGVAPRITWLALPLVVVVLAVLTTGVSLLLSAVYVRFRDVAQMWGLLVLVIFYGSPILYPVEYIPPGLKFLLFVNPLAPIMVEARRLVVDPTAPSVVDADAAGSVFGIIGPAMVMLAVCAIGLWTFMRAAPRVAEEL